MALYHCSNLEQIAAMFDDSAEKAYEIAAILRETEIHS